MVAHGVVTGIEPYTPLGGAWCRVLSGGKPVRVYPNSGVKRVVAFIPPGHMHVRFVVELEDQVVVLQEATVAGIVRAYAMVALHPSRRAVELVSRRLGRGERKRLFAEYQLVESGRGEEEVIEWALGLVGEKPSGSEGERLDG